MYMFLRKRRKGTLKLTCAVISQSPKRVESKPVLNADTTLRPLGAAHRSVQRSDYSPSLLTASVAYFCTVAKNALAAGGTETFPDNTC